MTPVNDLFTTTQLGNLFMLRLLAFVKDHNATVLDIDEHSARLQVGGRSFGDWFHGREYMDKTVIELSYKPAEQRSEKDPTERLDVAVQIKPRAIFRPRNFDAIATHLIREMRGYFAAI